MLNEYLLAFSERSVETNWNLLKHEMNSLLTLFLPCRTIIFNLSSLWFNVKLKCLSNNNKRIFHVAKMCGFHERLEAYETAGNAYKVTLD